MLDVTMPSEQFLENEPIKTQDGEIYLQDVEPCILPPMGEDASGLVQLKFMTIALETKIPLESFCRGLGIELLSFFKTVWLLVLRSYVETDTLCFGCMDGNSDPLESCFGFNLCKTDRVRQLLLSMQERHGQRYTPILPSPESGPCPRLFNTMVINLIPSDGQDSASDRNLSVQNTWSLKVSLSPMVHWSTPYRIAC